MELFAQNIHNLEEAFNLERPNLEQKGLDAEYIEFVMNKKRKMVVGMGRPSDSPPPKKDSTWYYDVVGDAEYTWGDRANYRDPEDMGWGILCTNASQFDYILRYYRQEYKKSL